MTKAKAGSQPGDETALSAQQSDAIHARDITTPDIGAQDVLITPRNAKARHTPYVKTGRLIRDARKRQGLKQTDLAQLLKVRQSAISQWEGGQRLPDMENRIRLSARLQIPLNDLMPEITAVPGELLEDPQARRVLDNFAAVDQATRNAVDVLLQQAREAHDQKRR